MSAFDYFHQTRPESRHRRSIQCPDMKGSLYCMCLNAIHANVLHIINRFITVLRHNHAITVQHDCTFNMSRSKQILLKLLTHDYTPWANRYVYWVKSPLGVLIVAAMVALICGMFVASQALVVFAAIAIVIGVGISWPWLGLRGVACDLSFARHRVREGDPVKVVVSIVNRWPLPVWGLAIEKGFFVASGDDVDETVVGLARIGALSKTEFGWKNLK